MVKINYVLCRFIGLIKRGLPTLKSKQTFLLLYNTLCLQISCCWMTNLEEKSADVFEFQNASTAIIQTPFPRLLDD